MVQTMKFLIVEPSPLPIPIPHHLRILFSNTLSLYSSLNVRDYVSQPYSTTGNIIVLLCNKFNCIQKNFVLKEVQLIFIDILMLDRQLLPIRPMTSVITINSMAWYSL